MKRTCWASMVEALWRPNNILYVHGGRTLYQVHMWPARVRPAAICVAELLKIPKREHFLRPQADNIDSPGSSGTHGPRLRHKPC